MAKRKGRRARGTGSIFKSEAKGVWIGRRTVGKDAKGKPVRVEVWGDTQAEVVRKLAAAGPAGPETTVSQWADLWMAGLDVRPPTRALYKRSLRLYIIPLLGTIQVKNLTINRVEVFGADLVKRGLKATTARLVMAHLRTMCTAALRDRLIDVNPCASARKPRGASKRLEPYPVSDLSRIIAHAPTYTPGGIIALLAACGCRVGEAIALDVPDFDPVAETISITKTWTPKLGVGPPKSKHSTRTIRVPVSVVPILRDAAGNRLVGPLFVSSVNNRRDRASVRDAWTRVCRDLGIDRRKPHQLRHSVATALISDGVPLGDVAAYLGDAVDTVVKTYLHATGGDPARALDRLLGGQKVGKPVKPNDK